MTTIVTTVAGLQYYALSRVADALQQGIRLRWQRDPGNLADRNAISLWLDRREAEAWEILSLIEDDGADTWPVGHVERNMAARLAPLLDGGEGMDVYVHGGAKDGGWSLDIRIEGTAAERADAARRAEKARAEFLEEISEGLAEVGRLYPGQGWDEDTLVTVDGRRLLVQPTSEYQQAYDARRFAEAGNGWLAAVRAPRRAAATAALGPIVEGWLAEDRAKLEVAAARRERHRAAQETRRQARYRAEVERIMSHARERGSLPEFAQRHEPHLPEGWLTWPDLRARGLRPADCEVVAWGRTPHHTPKNFYVPRATT